MAKKIFTDTNFLRMVIFASVFLVGGYHLAVSCFLSILLLLFLIYKSFSQKDFCFIKPNAVLIFIGLIVISFLSVTIWAVDKGTAIYGFFKILPVGLFTAILSIYDKSYREKILEAVPYAAASSGVLAYGLSFIPALSKYFLVAERLGGFFQSPNVFAVLCLAGIIILLTSKNISVINIIMTAILIGLIFLTGSRTVFLFLVAIIFVLLLTIKNKKIKIILLGLILSAVILSVIIVYFSGSVQTVGRFLTISLESSTLLGRILYYLDAIPVILEHPFGLGYYGYYFTQGSFQTGVYSVAFVHNSVLQFALDIGFVPAITFVLVIVASFFSKRTSLRQKLIIFALFGHSLFDFDMEFNTIFFILILALDFDLFKTRVVKFNSYLATTLSIILILFSVYFGIVNALYLFGEHKAVEKIYGHDTMAKMYLITNENNETSLLEYADEIIDENGYLAIAYDVKANYAYKKGNFKEVIEHKKKAIECAPYSIEEYIDYCEKLVVGISLYSRTNDINSAEVCKKELVKISDKLEAVKGNTNKLAWEIQDKPELVLPEEYVKLIEEYKESEK